jgi:hypothetical protein
MDSGLRTIYRTGVHAYGTDNDENATGADFDSADCGQPLSAVFRIHASIFTSAAHDWRSPQRMKKGQALSYPFTLSPFHLVIFRAAPHGLRSPRRMKKGQVVNHLVTPSPFHLAIFQGSYRKELRYG